MISDFFWQGSKEKKDDSVKFTFKIILLLEVSYFLCSWCDSESLLGVFEKKKLELSALNVWPDSLSDSLKGSSFTMELLTALRGISVSNKHNLDRGLIQKGLEKPLKTLPPRNSKRTTDPLTKRQGRLDQDENVPKTKTQSLDGFYSGSGKPPVARKSSLSSISNILQLSPRIFAKRHSKVETNGHRLPPHRENISMRTRSPSPEVFGSNNIELDCGIKLSSSHKKILFSSLPFVQTANTFTIQ